MLYHVHDSVWQPSSPSKLSLVLGIGDSCHGMWQPSKRHLYVMWCKNLDFKNAVFSDQRMLLNCGLRFLAAFDEVCKESPVWVDNFVRVRNLVVCIPLLFCWAGKKFYWLVQPFPISLNQKINFL